MNAPAVTSTPLVPSDQRWLGAPVADVQQSLSVASTFRTVRNGELQRVLNLVEQQNAERAASSRYRIHGLCAPISFLGRGKAAWTSLSDLLSDEPTAAGYAADFFADFTYELLVPSRVEALVAQPNYYQLYYVAAATQPDILAGTLSRDAWGATQFPFVLSRPLDLGGRVIAGLPVPLPVTFVSFRLRGPAATQCYELPTDWSGASLVPAAGSISGFQPETLDRVRPGLRTLLLQRLKPSSWAQMTDSAFVEWVLDQLLPLWASYNLQLSVDNVTLNLAFLGRQLGLDRAAWSLTSPEHSGEVLGPIMYFDPAEGHLTEVESQRYVYERSVRVSDTSAQRDELGRLAYRYDVSGAELVVPFRFAWNPFYSLPLRFFSPTVETAPASQVAGAPAWAWLDTSSNTMNWRDLLDPGVVQQGVGLDAPYLNDTHYVFTRVAHYVGPEMSFYNSFRAFRHVLPQTRLVASRVPRLPR